MKPRPLFLFLLLLIFAVYRTMYQAIGQRGNTIDKTTDILRKFRQEEGGSSKQHVTSDSQKDRFRLSLLYGAGVKRVNDFRGRKEPKSKGDERDYIVDSDTLDENIKNSIEKFMYSPHLTDEGVSNLSNTVSSSQIPIFELIHQMNLQYNINLTRIEMASLIYTWELRTGPRHKPMVDFNKFIKKLYFLSEQRRYQHKVCNAM